MYEIIKRYTLPDEFESKLKLYMETPKDNNKVNQHYVDYKNGLFLKDNKINSVLNLMLNFSGYNNLEEFCNDNIAPNMMIKVIDFIMNKEIKQYYLADIKGQINV